jgi:hypothetical protein
MLPEINICSKECVDLQELVKLSFFVCVCGGGRGGNIVNHERFEIFAAVMIQVF